MSGRRILCAPRMDKWRGFTAALMVCVPAIVSIVGMVVAAQVLRNKK